MERDLRIEAAETLLDRGVSLPLFPLWGGRTLRVVMRRPTLGSLIRIARLYMATGVTFAEIERFGPHEEMAYLSRHGVALSRMVALTICRGRVWGALAERPLAWLIRTRVPHALLMAACRRFVALLGVGPFLTFISSVERMNPMTPRLSHSAKGS